MNELGRNIRKLRQQQKLSQKEFGKTFNLAESTIGMYERGERKPDYATLSKIADYFNVSLDFLLGKDSVNGLPLLNEKEEKDIAKKLEGILGDLDSDSSLAFDGEPLDETTRELVRAQIESNLKLAKQLAKKKFTPNKYRD